MIPYTIREARRSDAGAVAALWQEMMELHSACDPRFRFGPNALHDVQAHFQETLRSREAAVYVAVAAGDVVGYVLGEMHVRRPLYPAGTYGFISDVAVRQAWRRRGIGRALANRMLHWLKEKGATDIELFAAEANPTAQAFWAALGFRPFLRMLRLEIRCR